MTGRYGGYEDQPFVAELYDYVYDRLARKGIEFFVDYSLKADGKTLELGCGTGRVLLPTAVAGCEITGLDFSPYMLQKCREKLEKLPLEVQERVNLIQASMVSFDSGEKYSLITIPFRSFQHLITLEEQKGCLDCVIRHLKKGGLFILDVHQPYLPRLTDTKYLMEMDVDPRLELPDGRILRRTTRTAAFHPKEQFNDIELIHYVTYPDGRQERLLQAFPMRYFFCGELEKLLKSFGLRVVALYGNYDKSAFTANSPEMIFVAEKGRD